MKAQPKGTWIVARYAFPTRLAEGRFPTRAELDTVAPDHMVLHQGGPAGVVNTRALTYSGISRDTADPPAGRIVKDPRTGEPTGMLRNAYSVLKDLPGDAYGDDGNAAEDERVKQLFRLYNERGITSIADRSASVPALSLYRRLRDRGQLTVRVNATRMLSPPFGNREAIVAKLNELASYQVPGEPNGPSGVGDHWVRIGPLKVFIDGGMLNGTAYMREPWGVGPTYQITEPDYRGLLFIKPQVLSVIATEAAPPPLADDRALRGGSGHGRTARGLCPRRSSRGHPPPALVDHARQFHFGREPEAVRGARRLGRLAAGLVVERHADLAQGARPKTDGVVSSLSQVARSGSDDRRRQRPHDPDGPDPFHQPVGSLAGHLGGRDSQDGGRRGAQS